MEHPKETQDVILQNILKRLQDSFYLKKYGRVKNYSDYAQKIPVVTYEDIAPFIKDMLEGKKDTLFKGDVKLFEKTSGSSSKVKYIPYPKELIEDFTSMFRLWTYDLLCYGPKFKTGTFYFSISPQFSKKETSASGAQINLESDEQYLQGLTRILLKPFIAVDPQIKLIQDPEEFKKTLKNQLSACPDLEIISVWNPSFLTALFDDRNKPRETQSDLPSLKLISCWGSSLARYDFELLKKTFPHVFIQEKGLLATEAPVTIPLINAPAPVPLSHIVFLEFRDSAGEILRLHELEKSKEYELIISQRGGLYRYDIGDRVRVVDFYKKTPCLEFVGRTESTCDLVGEKLSESFIEGFFEQRPLDEMSVVIPSKKRGQYILISSKAGLNKELEDYLMGSYHYSNARKLGQLGPVARFETEFLSKNHSEMLLDFFETQRNMLRGDIKFRRLYTKEWDDELLDWLLSKKSARRCE